MTRSAIGLLVLVATTVGAAACATGRAQIPEPEPTLVVPAACRLAPSTRRPWSRLRLTYPSPTSCRRPRLLHGRIAPVPAAEAKVEPKQEPPVESVGPVSTPATGGSAADGDDTDRAGSRAPDQGNHRRDAEDARQRRLADERRPQGELRHGEKPLYSNRKKP